MAPKKKTTPAWGQSSRAAPQSMLKRRAAEYRKLLNERLFYIQEQYRARACEIKQRATDKIRERKRRISENRARERRRISAKLLKLLDARDAKLQAIAGKLEEMKREYRTFAACLSAVYKTVGYKASNLPGISPGLRGARTSNARVARWA